MDRRQEESMELMEIGCFKGRKNGWKGIDKKGNKKASIR